MQVRQSVGGLASFKRSGGGDGGFTVFDGRLVILLLFIYRPRFASKLTAIPAGVFVCRVNRVTTATCIDYFDDSPLSLSR